MTREHAFQFVKYLATGAGTLTMAQHDALSAADPQVALDILDHRLRELEGSRLTGLNPRVTHADQVAMIASVREVRAQLLADA